MRHYILFLCISFPCMLLAQGRVGINTDSAIVQLDVRALSSNENTLLNIANQDNSYFTRLLAGHAGFPFSSLSWTAGTSFNFGTWDGFNFTQILHLNHSRKVGINTFDPQFDLDVRGTDDALDGGELQLGTPGETNFLRFFGGRTGDPHPFIAFSDTDTFHVVSTSEDWSSFAKHLTVFPDGRVGIGTENPGAILDVAASGDGVELLRMSSDKPWVFKQLGSGIGTRLALQTTVNDKAFTILSEDGTNRVAEFFSSNDLSTVRLVPDSGYVGIGVEQPSAPLEVFSDHGESGFDTVIIAKTVVQTPGEFQQTIGVYGEGTGTSAIGVYGKASNTAGLGIGVRGYSNSHSGTGVSGYCDGGGVQSIGVRGSAAGTGVSGTGGIYGVKGQASNAASDVTYGVHGESNTTEGIGVFGDGNTGVKGHTYDSDGVGILGANSSMTGSAVGVKGTVESASGYAVYGEGGFLGVYGKSPHATGSGVRGYSTSTTGTNNGVFGESLSSAGRGVYGMASGADGKALYGYATGIFGKALHVEITSTHSSANAILAESGGGDSYAGYFVGKLHVAGTLSKSSGSFKIDHPLDPENKYLYHSFVESPDMMNIYNGNTVTDDSGNATIELPEYFEALNMDFRYQLTVIGSFAQAIISDEVADNQFSIMTDKPNIKVSWQVTGVRKDAYAEDNRIMPVVDKEPENRGRYLNPEAFGQPETSRIGRRGIQSVQNQPK